MVEKADWGAKSAVYVCVYSLRRRGNAGWPRVAAAGKLLRKMLRCATSILSDTTSAWILYYTLLQVTPHTLVYIAYMRFFFSRIVVFCGCCIKSCVDMSPSNLVINHKYSIWNFVFDLMAQWKQNNQVKLRPAYFVATIIWQWHRYPTCCSELKLHSWYSNIFPFICKVLHSRF